VAVELAEGLFKRRDAKDAEKRAFDADVIGAPIKQFASGRQQVSLFASFAPLGVRLEVSKSRQHLRIDTLLPSSRMDPE
jgi:hypothetical protein